MHDHTYRMAVAWQNCAYNQPPHLGYYLPDFASSFQGVEDDVTAIADSRQDKRVVTRTYYNLQGQQMDSPVKSSQIYMVKERHADGSITTKKYQNR